MSALLYISYSSGLSEDDKLVINRQVYRNQEKICTFLKILASNGKTKKVIVGILLGGSLYFSTVQRSEAIGLYGPVGVGKVQPEYRYRYKKKYEMKVIPTVNPQINFIQSRELPVFIYMMDEKFLNRRQNIELINKIRGGNLVEATTALIIIVIMWQILAMGAGVDGFVPNNPNRGGRVERPHQFQPSNGYKYPPVYNFFSPRKTPSYLRPESALEISQPSSMPHQEFVGLTKEQKRSISHINDMKIIHEGRPKLEVGFWQSRFKVGRHGEAHGLDYIVKPNGKLQTQKTDQNTLSMMASIVDMPNRDNVEWFEDGMYQGGTNREFEAIHIYDLENRIIAVFKKKTGRFVTTCRLNLSEHNELLATRNFGGEKRKLIKETNNLNMFKNDFREMPSTINDNLSLGFTSKSNFESDVMGITSIDKSQFDNP